MPIVNRDKVVSGYNGNMENLVHDKEMVNGLFVAVGPKVEGERELYKVAAPTKENLATEEFLLINGPEIMYDERLYRKRDFRIEAGTAVRAYRLAKGDVLTLTNDLFDGVLPKVGEFVVPATNGSMKLTKQAEGVVSTLVFEVVDKDSLDVIDGDALRIKCKSA